MKSRSGHPDELLTAAVSGDLTPAERVELDVHLAECAVCQKTLDAHLESRQLLGSTSLPPAPPDLADRVQRGLAAGGWRWPIRVGTSLATIAAAVGLVIILKQSVDLPSASNEPGASQTSSAGPSTSNPEPTPIVTPEPGFLASGDMGYLVLSGGGFADYRLAFVNARTGAEVAADAAPSGAIVASTLSPNGRWLAYLSILGETGVNEVWVMDLTDGSTRQIGCTAPAVYSDRLVWSPDSQILAYTLVAVDGASELVGAGCEQTEAGDPGTSDAWLFDTTTLDSRPMTTDGDVYVASFIPSASVAGGVLWISHISEMPSSQAWGVLGSSVGTADDQVDGVFLPTVNSADSAVLFSRPVFAHEGADWSLQGDGIPLIGSVSREGPPPVFSGTESIDPGSAGSSLTPWQVSWSADADTFAVWAPNWETIFIGHASTPGAEHAREVRVPFSVEGAWIVAVVLSPDASVLTVTMGVPSAGIGDPPTSLQVHVDPASGSLAPGCCTEPVWVGPAVFGR